VRCAPASGAQARDLCKGCPQTSLTASFGRIYISQTPKHYTSSCEQRTARHLEQRGLALGVEGEAQVEELLQDLLRRLASNSIMLPASRPATNSQLCTLWFRV